MKAKPSGTRLRQVSARATQLAVLLIIALLPVRGLLDSVNRISIAHVHVRVQAPSHAVDDHDDHHAHHHAHQHHHDNPHQHDSGTRGVVSVVDDDSGEPKKTAPDRADLLVPTQPAALAALTRGGYPRAQPVALDALAYLPGERPPRA